MLLIGVAYEGPRCSRSRGPAFHTRRLKRWNRSTSGPCGAWALVASAAASGVLDETHWVELKEAIPPTNRPANLELARDLASLSVDGGLLVVGIEDAKGKAGAVVGTPLPGLADRIAQVAQGAVTPPLGVNTTEVPQPGEPEKGVLVVSVPGSLDAPHMVDERYWGRSDKGKRVLSDPEVRRLLENRNVRRVGFSDRLQDMESPDNALVPASRRLGVNVCLLLEPAAPPFQTKVSEELGHNFNPELLLQTILGYNPKSLMLSSLLASPHHDGVVLTTVRDDGLVLGHGPARILLGDNGTLTFWAGDQTVQLETQRFLSVGSVRESVDIAARLAGHLGSTVLGISGQWTAGLLVTGLKGFQPLERSPGRPVTFGGSRRPGHPFPSDLYERVTRSTTAELAEAPSRVVVRLTADLARAMGVPEATQPYDDPQTIV